MTTALERRFSLTGKVALVSGAGQGIGRGIALCLAEAGAAVAVQDLEGAAARRVADEIRALGGSAAASAGDMTRPETIDGFLDTAQRELGRPDILVNNAGIYPFSSFLEIPLEEWDRVLALNLRSAFLATQKAGRIMADGGRGGRIVNVASIQALRPSGPGVAAYNMSKAGVVMLTKSAALELAAFGIGVNAVAPGIVATPGTKTIIDTNQLGDPKDLVPLGGRWATTDDVADAVLYLVSPAGAYVTGETIVIDGGYLLK
ncbi:MAG: SDR family oxidoreductase [Deltaproteobacteria bacterium]|nr:SDR family oxidoreductase [Deltaproteobacteria bacterium]